MKVALYARFSSDLQNPKSADDQLLACRAFVDRRWSDIDIDIDMVVSFKDEALSGQSMDQRIGLNRMLKTIDTSGWVVVTESIDRLSRDLGDMVAIFKQLMSQNVSLVTVDHGEIDYLQMGIRGTFSTVAVQDMIKKVRRGQKAKAKRGLFPSGISYGYRVVRDAVDALGRPINGQRAIEPEQAAVVRRIFAERDAGLTNRAIAMRLNEDNIKSARNGLWRLGTIRDLTRNPLYRGTLIYNRTTLSPDRRSYINNPPSEWVKIKRLDLQIIDPDLWYRVQKKKPLKPTDKKPKAVGRLSIGVSKLVRCGVCGSRNVLSDRNRLVCANAKIRQCTNYRRVSETEALMFVLEESRTHMLRISSWKQEIALYHATEPQSVQQARNELQSVETQIARWTQAIDDGVNVTIAVQRINQLQSSMEKLRQQAALNRKVNLKYPPRTLVRRGINQLSKAIDNSELRYLARDTLPLFVEKIISTPIKSHRQGSTLSVVFKKHGWPRFLQTVQDLWPPDKTKK